jgi:hypothetical protein
MGEKKNCNGFDQRVARQQLRKHEYNNRKETVFYAVRAGQKDADMGSLLPCNAALNMHPQQWETVFMRNTWNV